MTHWPKDDYGKFYDGDSYILLNTYKKPDSDVSELARGIHWLLQPLGRKELQECVAGLCVYMYMKWETAICKSILLHVGQCNAFMLWYSQILFRTRLPVPTKLKVWMFKCKISKPTTPVRVAFLSGLRSTCTCTFMLVSNTKQSCTAQKFWVPSYWSVPPLKRLKGEALLVVNVV